MFSGSTVIMGVAPGVRNFRHPTSDRGYHIRRTVFFYIATDVCEQVVCVIVLLISSLGEYKPLRLSITYRIRMAQNTGR